MLPPIKIKLCDRDKFMGLSKVAPIKIRLEEIQNSKENTKQYHPIKIKLCDRDKFMETSHKDNSILGEMILGFGILGSKSRTSYIKPIIIKLSTLDLVYDWLHDLVFKFNFAVTMTREFVKVISYGKFVTRLIHKTSITDTLAKIFGKLNHSVKFKNVIQTALDIFKVEGLRNSIVFKYSLKGNEKIFVNEDLVSPIIFNVPPITQTIIYDIRSRTIGELTEGTIEDQFLNDRTVHDIIFTKVERKDDSILGAMILGKGVLGDKYSTV